MARSNRNTTKDLKNKLEGTKELDIVEEVKNAPVSSEKTMKKYLFVHEDEFLYIPDLRRRNHGHQFVKGQYETDDLEVAKYIFNFSGVICLRGKEDLIDLY